MKKKTIIIIVAAAILVAAAVVGGILIAKSIQNRNHPDVNTDSIKVPGFTEIEVSKDTDTVNIYLENPEGNPCNFVYQIVLKESGEVLYTSPSIAPGESITEEKLGGPIAAGRYNVTVNVSTTSIKDGTPMNGASFDTVLVAK